MIEELRIRDLGVIDDVTLELHPGLTVVTGETGAGKTMVVNGLGLLLGHRADSGQVRRGADRAVVEGRVRVDPDGPVARRAVEAGGQLDADALVLARTVSAEGRSRAHVGGTGAPVGLLAELAEALVAVHGQSDQQRLLRPARVRELVDRFAARPELFERWTRTYRDWQQARRECAALRESEDARRQEADLLRFDLAEIASVGPQPGEDAALVAEEVLLAHGDDLLRAALSARDSLQADDGPDAATAVASARRALAQVRDHDPALASLADRADEIGVLAAELASDLAAYAASVDTDPRRLAAVGERRAALAVLTRKHGPAVSDVLEWAAQAEQRLARLAGSDDRLGELTDAVSGLQKELSVLAPELTACRSEAAARLGAAVTGELAALAMPHAVVTGVVSQRTDDEGLVLPDGRRVSVAAHGVDDVDLLLRPHTDSEPRALAKGASGGELSRVMLALEVALAGVDPVPTFVFDEVDAGVGGTAAVEVGRRLARLAAGAQVLVVTHLPQVAAFADRHLVVAKTSDGRVTRSGVTALDDAGRAQELGRMLAGLADSDLGRAHAEELLEVATAAKSAWPVEEP
ncbi:MAG: DNA repair protein RecN [Actinomycetota bacterium]|nr:DNA repair protein RecN [Actinomycetota bacterium]MDH4352438.1 DNA repair protein RecN [Actinomycetota bacterium]MDH5277421.1 DNA repair protein RecN [Actinomycetota bacterium]